jgi:putative transposase
MEGDSTIFPQRQKLPPATPSWVRDGAIFFVTACGAPRNTRQPGVGSTAPPLRESIEFRQRRGDWHVPPCWLMPDHLHALISFPRDMIPTNSTASGKEVGARKTGGCWQRDCFDHRRRNNESHGEKALYIRPGPVRKDLVQSPEDWKFVWEPKGRRAQRSRPTP